MPIRIAKLTTAFEMADDFLFTWKPEHWPHENILELIKKLASGLPAEEPWRCRAHKMIHEGANAYLFKQGQGTRGIFGVGKVVGPVQVRPNVKEGESEHAAPIRFRLLVDPLQRFLVSEDELLVLGAQKAALDTQSSGMPFDSLVSRGIDKIIEERFAENSNFEEYKFAEKQPIKRERLAEVYERDQKLVGQLKTLYSGQCQICGTKPFNGLFGNIAEGHHIVWLSRGGADTLRNMVLLCPNHHAAVHSFDPTFDWTNMAFKFGTRNLPLRLRV